jgi:hypothetical protein
MTDASRKNAFSKEIFERAEEDYRAKWMLVYDTLRNLCVKHPKHESFQDVAAKVWLIGRAYSTQIERKVQSDGTQGSSLTKIVSHITNHGAELDGWLAKLPENEERLAEKHMRIVLEVHGNFMQLMSTITKGQGARSFVSKYLHFHRPVVPIYDSVAVASLQKQVRWSEDVKKALNSDAGDPEYRYFLMRLTTLQARAEAAGFVPSVRQLDWYLMYS